MNISLKSCLSTVTVWQVAIAAMLYLSATCPELSWGNLLKPAEAYQATCDIEDMACEAWNNFRNKHPYPYQAIQGHRLSDGSLAIFIFEPPPKPSKQDLDSLISHAFGDDLRSLRRMRWKIGVDGWLEDVILHIDSGSKEGDPLADVTLRERVAFLHLAIFGTAFGSRLDMLEDNIPTITEGPLNIKVTPHDVRTWVTDSILKWTRLDTFSHKLLSWKSIMANKAIGCFASTDKTLVALSFPSSLIQEALGNPDRLDSLQASFRTFAVSMDTIVGIIHGRNGQVAILGRWRTVPVSSVPPLRFETFKQIASQSTDELAQSYERTSVFSGKLFSGSYALHDWAPIFLSEALVDTEFGALLNTTDQLLKSWSQAGFVEYLHFNYPRPEVFPFGERTLVDVVNEETGSSQVLFNWNTSGAGVLVSTPVGRILTATQTGALPITYGSDSSTNAEMKTGHLLAHENKSYDYFATRRDPNLQRVVAYTMLYQFCRAITSTTSSKKAVESPTSSEFAAMDARRKAAMVRVTATMGLIDAIQKDQIELDPDQQNKIANLLKATRTRYPAYDDQQIASILADRMSPEAKKLQSVRQIRFTKLIEELVNEREDFSAKVAAHEDKIKIYNERVKEIQSGRQLIGSQLAVSKLIAEKSKIEREEHALLLQKSKIMDLQKLLEDFMKSVQNDPMDQLRQELFQIAQEADLETVRKDFVKQHEYEPDSNVKTPSIVVSWSTRDLLDALFMTGGHNVSSKALHFEPSPGIKGMVVEETEKGLVLKYNPSMRNRVESQANQLARAIEHQHVTSANNLKKLLPATDPKLLPKAEILQLPENYRSEDWAANLGTKIYEEQSAFIKDLRTIAEKNDCCVFVAYDNKGVALATEKSLKPPPATLAYEIRDAASMQTFVGSIAKKRSGAEKERALVFFDTPESHVEATMQTFNAESKGQFSLMQMADTLGARKTGTPEPRISAISTKDLGKRPSIVRLMIESLDARAKSLIERFTKSQPKPVWTKVEVSVHPEGETATLLEALNWDAAEHGIPSSVIVKFVKSAQTPLDIGVVAGVPEGAQQVAQTTLKTTVEKNLHLAKQKEASFVEYAASIRNDLQQMTDLKIRRLSIIVKEGETTTLLTMRFPVRLKHYAHRLGEAG